MLTQFIWKFSRGNKKHQYTDGYKSDNEQTKYFVTYFVWFIIAHRSVFYPHPHLPFHFMFNKDTVWYTQSYTHTHCIYRRQFRLKWLFHANQQHQIRSKRRKYYWKFYSADMNKCEMCIYSYETDEIIKKEKKWIKEELFIVGHTHTQDYGWKRERKMNKRSAFDTWRRASTKNWTIKMSESIWWRWQNNPKIRVNTIFLMHISLIARTNTAAHFPILFHFFIFLLSLPLLLSNFYSVIFNSQWK